MASTEQVNKNGNSKQAHVLPMIISHGLDLWACSNDPWIHSADHNSVKGWYHGAGEIVYVILL